MLGAPTACSNVLAAKWAMQAETGELLYGCPVSSWVWDYYNVKNERKLAGVGRIFAWNAGDAKLTSGPKEKRGLLVISATGTMSWVTGLGECEPKIVRAHGRGFWIACSTRDKPDQRFSIDESGKATLDGAFAPIPPEAANQLRSYLGNPEMVLDSAGTLYHYSRTGRGGELVVRRPLGGASTVVYPPAPEVCQGANVWPTTSSSPKVCNGWDGVLFSTP